MLEVTAEPTECWSRLLKVLQQAFNDGKAESLIQLITTADEREALVTRLLIIEALIHGEVSQRELKNRLGAGIATITRGSNSLKEISPTLKQWLKTQLPLSTSV